MELSYENLKKYVDTVLQLEKEKMVLENSRVQMEKKRNSLGQNFKKPKPPEFAAVQEKVSGIEIIFYIGALVTFIILFMSFCMHEFSLEGVNVGIYIGIAAVLVVIGIIEHISELKVIKSNKKYAEEDYMKQLKRYDDLITKKIKQRDDELALIPRINQDIDIIEAEHQRVENLLADYYSLGIIYPVYHGDFVAIAMFSQYLNMGMCYTLTGHEGCYTLYEQQKLQGIIITKLNVIISQLDEISGQLRSLQYSLLQAISETNEKIDKLTVYAKEQGNLQQQHNAVMEYKADCMESEMKFHNQYVMFRDLINQ